MDQGRAGDGLDAHDVHMGMGTSALNGIYVAAGASRADLAVGVCGDGGIAPRAMEYEEGQCVGAWLATQKMSPILIYGCNNALRRTRV